MDKTFVWKLIKTDCGRAKYQELSAKKGFLALVRKSWFVFFGAIKDFPISYEGQSDTIDS